LLSRETGETPMFTKPRLQCLLVLATGAVLGYVFASSKPELFSRSHAATPGAAVSERTADHAVSSAVCLSEPKATSQLRAMADGDESIVRVVQAPRRSSSGKKPNIVFIMGDDIGWFNIGAYHRGIMSGKTPNLDKLASQGMLFTDYYAEASCT